MMEHSKLPWFIDRDDRRDMEWNVSIINGAGKTICFMTHDGTRDIENKCPVTEANAALIVRAVNSHEELVEALKGLLENYKLNKGAGLGLGPIYKAKAALQKASQP